LASAAGFNQLAFEYRNVVVIATDSLLIVHALVNQNVQIADGERDGMLVGRKKRYFSPW